METVQIDSEAMKIAIARRNTETILQLLDMGFDITDTPVTSDGRELPYYYYVGELLQAYIFYNCYTDLLELLPLFLERVKPLDSMALRSFGRINADEYTERIIRLLVLYVEDINEQDRSGNSILHERLRGYRNTYFGLLNRNEIVPPEKNEPDIMLDILLEREDLDVNLMNYEDLPPLYYACQYTTGRLVRELLGKGADLHVLCGKQSNTMLHVACEGEKVDIVSVLLDFGIDVNAANTDSETALHIACKKQNVELIRGLLESGADTAERDKYGNTPLHLLVQETTPRTIECIDLLLEKGADINALNNNMCTPFFASAQITDRQFRNRNASLLKHLLSKGAYADTQDFRQNNPLYYAVEHDDLEQVSLLLKVGVDPNSRNGENVSPYKLALLKNRRAIISLIEKSQVTITATPDDLDAAFMEACISGKRGVAEMLFKSGNIDITYVDDYGRTPLHYIAKAGMVALAGFVLDKGVNIDYTDKDDQTALHVAAAFRQKEMIRLLLARGADGNIRDNDGLLPIHYVARSGQFDVLALMWKQGYDLEATTNYGDTPLHIAAFRRAKENVRLLLSIGVQPDPQNSAGVTPLQHAVVGNQKEIVKMLVESGADICRADVDGDTPIHWAANHGYKDMLHLLLELGADIDALNNAHQTALHIAAIRKNKDLFKYLLEAGADFEIKTAKGNSCIDLATATGQKELIELIGIIQRRRAALAD